AINNKAVDAIGSIAKQISNSSNPTLQQFTNVAKNITQSVQSYTQVQSNIPDNEANVSQQQTYVERPATSETIHPEQDVVDRPAPDFSIWDVK
ncbi:MAG: hypothetical protein IK123_00410, partial [Lachnospiraceae bacterium]|nr:hypothetical protein [Lachnospiraceae bacterium]